MNQHFKDIILKATRASELFEIETIQNLWSGYGKIIRIGLKDSEFKSVVVKHVKLPDNSHHPRGWNTSFSHERKVKSYKVETAWYEFWNSQCDNNCRTPHVLALQHLNDEVLMVMEDLDASGFSGRLSSVNWKHMQACISWLAHFHATFINQTPDRLWDVGTYWHLDTRPDELKIMDDLELKKAAPAIDNMLRNGNYQTLVHGDAKLANFCFSEDGQKVAAVDFQYVGGGCGMKDLAYFVGSCLYEDDCEAMEEQILGFYFTELKTAITTKQAAVDFNKLEKEWRELYPVAWTDFHRFLKGWSPDHWKINSYSERMAREVIAKLKENQ
ncbi:oxidoreductase family protein [Carboxylicivirga sp. RSCT41]|uniref:oxidoreductase family protein n=1 Tax=Carboxylicivirga agarovorans TaxID=3417570 RepID=UPI003D340820